jgi:hypothetical protein
MESTWIFLVGSVERLGGWWQASLIFPPSLFSSSQRNVLTSLPFLSIFANSPPLQSIIIFQ